MDLVEVNCKVLLKKTSKEIDVSDGKVVIGCEIMQNVANLLNVMNYMDSVMVVVNDLRHRYVYKDNGSLCMNISLLADKVFGMDLARVTFREVGEEIVYKGLIPDNT